MERLLWLLLLGLLSTIALRLNSKYDELYVKVDDKLCELHFSLVALPEEERHKLPGDILEIYEDEYYIKLCLGD